MAKRKKGYLPSAIEAALARMKSESTPDAKTLGKAAVEKPEFANIDTDNAKIKNKEKASIRRLHDLYFSVFRPHAYDSETNTWRKWKYGERAKIYRQVKSEAGERFQFLRNLFASRMALKHSNFRSTRGIIKNQFGRGVIPIGSPYGIAQVSAAELRKRNAMRKAASSSRPPTPVRFGYKGTTALVPAQRYAHPPKWLSSAFQAQYNPFRNKGAGLRDDFRRIAFDTNWAYKEAAPAPTGMAFFPPVTKATARKMREDDAEARERKRNRYEYARRQAKRRREDINERRHNKWQYLRAQARRRRRLFDEYKWLKPIAKSSPLIAKHLPKIEKMLATASKVPIIGRALKHPYLVGAGLALASQNAYLNNLERINKRRNIERYFGTPSSDDLLAQYSTGMSYEKAAASHGKFAALESQIRHGENLGAIYKAAMYGLPEAAVFADPLIPLEEKKRIVAQAAQRLPEGDRINVLNSLGFTPEEYSAALLIGKPEESLTKEQMADRYAGQFKKYTTEKLAQSETVLQKAFWWLLSTDAVGGFLARDKAVGDYDRIHRTGPYRFLPLPEREAEAAAQSLAASPIPLAEAAAQSLAASNARATDADIAAITNYNSSERPVTVVIQGDIRTDASNGEALYNDIEKSYGINFLTEIAQPVATAFDSKRVR